MENEERKNTEVVRLEERTSALERCDRRHYVFEVILFIAFILLTLLVVASCDIVIPEKVETRAWIYTEVKENKDVLFRVNSDGESVTATARGRDYVIGRNDTKAIVPISLTLKISIAEERIDIINADDNSTIGYFEFK